MTRKARKTYCVQFYVDPHQRGLARYTHVGIHACEDEGHRPHQCFGRGHDRPGAFVHVRTASPVAAIQRALGCSYKTAKRIYDELIRGW